MPPRPGARTVAASRGAASSWAAARARVPATPATARAFRPGRNRAATHPDSVRPSSWYLDNSLGRQTIGQTLAGAAQPHVHRRGIDFQDLRNLAGVVVQGVAQRQDLAIRRRQLL